MEAKMYGSSARVGRLAALAVLVLHLASAELRASSMDKQLESSLVAQTNQTDIYLKAPAAAATSTSSSARLISSLAGQAAAPAQSAGRRTLGSNASPTPQVSFLLSSPTSVNHHPSSQSTQQLLQQHQLSVENPTTTAREPKWVRPCSKRSPTDGLVSVLVAPQVTSHPRQVLEADRRARDKFFGPARPQPQVDAGGVLVRERRAIDRHNQLEQLQVGGRKASILYGKQVGGWPYDTKKTSFALASKRKVGGKSKSRFYLADDALEFSGSGKHASSTAVASSPTTKAPESLDANATTTAVATEELKALQPVLDAIFSSDIRVSWYINCALNSASSGRRLVGQVRRSLAGELRGGGQHAAPEGSDWLPRLETLMRRRQSSGTPSAHLMSHAVLANVSSYFEYFSVAFEQMAFEQQSPPVVVDSNQQSATATASSTNAAMLVATATANRSPQSPMTPTYARELERAGLKVLCDLWNLVRLLDTMRASRSELVALMQQQHLIAPGRDAHESLRRLNVSVVNSMERRTLYTGDSLDAPGERQAASRQEPAQQQVADTNKQVGQQHVGRQVMPLAQRRLESRGERSARDLWILGEFERLIDFYEGILIQIYSG